MAIKRYPGFIDVHVHLRDPGATHKEDFRTGTRAALAGGVTQVIDMPNNPIPTITRTRLEQKKRLAKEKSKCFVGFYFGTNGKNVSEFEKVMDDPWVFGLKLYCNHTTGEMLIEDLELLEEVFDGWNCKKPILVHAEGVQLAAVIGLAKLYRRRLHVCHISQAIEVELVRRAKKEGLEITAGACPHHLFLLDRDRERMGGMAVMKPPLGTWRDQKSLWEGLKTGVIDVVETDHAPHTRQEKIGKNPAFGVPGLETVVGLLFLAVKKRKMTEKELIEYLFENPRRIFGLPDQKKTYVELDPDRTWVVGKTGYESKCGWSPFEGWKLYGKIERVVLEGKVVVDEGKVVTEGGK